MIFTDGERDTLRKLLVRLAIEWNDGNHDEVIDEVYAIIDGMGKEEKKQVVRFIISLRKAFS